MIHKENKKAGFWKFPGGPVGRTLRFHCLGSIPGWGTKIPQALLGSQKKGFLVFIKAGFCYLEAFVGRGREFLPERQQDSIFHMALHY